MIDVEPFIINGLNALVPAPGNSSADWPDVRRRAGVRPPRRRLVLVLALVCAGVFVAIAIASSIGGFSNWLTGEPGTPAPPGAQQAFAKGIRSWTGFPKGTQLRQLAQTKVDGATYTLFGFRGAGSLCLRLEVTGNQSVRDLVCPPLSQLRSASAPALVAVSDYGVGIGKAAAAALPIGMLEPRPPAARVTFGIVADGVGQVELAHSDGKTTHAVVSGDAFVSIDDQPSSSEHVTHIWAVDGGKRIAIPFTAQLPQPFAPRTPTAPRLTLHGPANVQRVVHGGGIRWLARREPEGVSVPKGVHDIVGTSKRVIFAREITPNPSAPERLVVSVLPNPHGDHLLNKLQVCVDVVGGRYANSGGGCWPAGQMFSAAPFTLGVGEGGSQYVTIAGLASDNVARLDLYLGTGQTESVPLHDNGYLIEAPTVDEPLRLVAYDNHGLVIGTEPIRGGVYFSIGGPQPAQPVANAHWRRIIKNSAGDVFVAPGSNGTTCYAINFGSRGAGSVFCPPRQPADGLDIGWFWSKPDGMILDLRTGSAITKVVVRYENGRTQTLKASDGIVLARVPTKDQTRSRSRGLAGVTGLDASDRVVVSRQNVVGPTGGSGTINKLTAHSISIGKTSCQVTAISPSLSGYQTGVHVQYLCNNGILSLIGRSKPGHLWANRSVLSRGTITKVTTSALTISDTLQPKPGTAAPLTCTLTATSPSLAKYRDGEQVQIFCVSGKLTGINRT